MITLLSGLRSKKSITELMNLEKIITTLEINQYSNFIAKSNVII
jgi:hypothetical protein